MRFGGLIFKEWKTPEEWAQAAKEMGYTGVYFPVDYTADQKLIDGFVEAAKENDLVICETGAWSNLLSVDPERKQRAFERNVHQLELADYIGANCCVNIAGSYHPRRWDGPHPDNFTRKAFDEIVSVTQRIIDTAKPQRTYYAIEPMPNMYPNTADSYLDLIEAIDRKHFGAHVDIVNIISSPTLYYTTGDVIREWFRKLSPYIRSCHAKDIILRDQLTVHLDECRPGTGGLDYDAYLTCLNKLDDRICLMMEHMTEEEDYILASQYIRGRAEKLNIRL